MTSAVRTSLKSVRWPLALAAVGLLLAAFLIMARPTQGASVQVNAVGGAGVYAGETVPVRVVTTLAATETIDLNTDLVVDILGGQSFQFTLPLQATGTVTEHSGAGVLRGSMTRSSNVNVGAATITSDGATPATITFNGSFTVPLTALPGSYLVRARVTDHVGVQQSTAQFTVLEEEGDPSVSPTPSGPSESSAAVRMTIRNSVEIPSGDVLSALQSQVRAALGGNNIVILGGNSSIINDGGNMVLQLHGLNIAQGMPVNGPINIDAPQIELSTNNGSGTVTLQLGDGISLTADVTITPRAGRLDVTLRNARISFAPQSPDIALLTGGSSNVTALSAGFNVGITALPEGSVLVVTFAKDTNALVPGANDVFSTAAEALGGNLDSLSDDVAFTVEATTEVLTNSQLGGNNVTLTVSRAWYDARTGEGKPIAIVKRDSAGNVHAAEATCTPGGSNVTCRATFSGSAGGFSSFSLFAVGQEATSTPTATPTATPGGTVVAPTVTPTVTTGGPGGSNLPLIIIVVVVVAAVAGGAFFFLKRKPGA